MAKKEEAIVELTEVVEEGENIVDNKIEDTDLDKELEDLLDVEDLPTESKERSDGGNSSTLEDELDALLEEEGKGTTTSNEDSEGDIDIDSIFEKLDEDLNIEDEEENTQQEPVEESEVKGDKVSEKIVDQDEIDSLFEESDKETEEEVVTDDIAQNETGSSLEDVDEKPTTLSQIEPKGEPEEFKEVEESEQTSSVLREEFNELKEIILNLKDEINNIDNRFQELETNVVEKVKEIISEPSTESPELDLSEVNNNIEGLKREVEQIKKEFIEKIKYISEKLEKLHSLEKDSITSFFSDLKQELIQEIHTLVPAEAAKIVKEEIKALEQELEEEE